MTSSNSVSVTLFTYVFVAEQVFAEIVVPATKKVSSLLVGVKVDVMLSSAVWSSATSSAVICAAFAHAIVVHSIVAEALVA